MKTNILIRALCFTALAIALIGNANAQKATYEYRLDSACVSAEEYNRTGKEYAYWEEKIEINPTVGERPTTIYAMDTDGVNGIDTWTNDEGACAEMKVVDCQPLENNDNTIIFEDRAGQDNVRLAPKVEATF